MVEVAPVLYAFNRGLVSKLALARQDLKRVGLSAEVMNNWMPRRVGSMMLRPGLQYLSQTAGNAPAVHIPFAKAIGDLAYIQLTGNLATVYVNDAPISRASVATFIAGTFPGNLNGWAQADDTGASSFYDTDGVNNYMALVGTGFNSARRNQTAPVAAGDIGKEHGIRLVVSRGVVTLRISSQPNGGDDLFAQTDFRPGAHSLAVTPTTANMYIQISSITPYKSWLNSITVEPAGIMTLPTIWPQSAIYPTSKIRYAQSADVIFVACDGFKQQRFERHSTRGWGVADYVCLDGPFNLPNVGPTLLSPSATSGDITLTASLPLFQSGHVGALFSLTSTGQDLSGALSGANQFGPAIKITGTTTRTTPLFGSNVDAGRSFLIKITGTWAGTITLQRSISAPGAWVDVPSGNWTANVTTAFDDGLPNTIAYYQIGFKVGNYTSGTATVELIFHGGSTRGIVRITAVAGETSASAQVLSPLGGMIGSNNWEEGFWSSFRGFPTSLAFFEGRLWWAGRNAVVASVSDAYNSFDETIEGDSGPIIRTIGDGMVDVINWLLPLYRLIVGAQDTERPIRSSTLDDPITPTNFNMKTTSTQGSATAMAVPMDTAGFFIQRSGYKVFRLEYNFSFSYIDYATRDMTVLVPELALAHGGFVKLAIQRQPETRVHALMADGTVAVLVFDSAEDVQCWVTVSTAGIVEDAFVLPGTLEDQVYYLVNRTINGATVRYLERWAREDQCQGGTQNMQADSFVAFSGPPTNVISAPSLAGSTQAVLWADGKDQGQIFNNGMPISIAANGTYTLPNGATVSSGVIGLAYTAQFQSSKLAQAIQGESGLLKRKSIARIGLVLDSTHAQGLAYGKDFASLDSLPPIEDDTPVDPTSQWPAYDKDAVAFDGSWDTDARVCLQAAAPRNVTALACVIEMDQS